MPSALRSRAATNEVRFVGRVPGRYTLPRRRARSGVYIFACNATSISPSRATIAGPVIGPIDEPVSMNLDGIGLVRGHIVGHIKGGFIVDIDPIANDLEKLTGRIEWLTRKVVEDVQDGRSYKRVIPRDPHSTLVLPGGAMVDCFVIDMSSSGCAVSADIHPDVGVHLAVGKILGKVVRHQKVGFAIKFLDVQKLDTLEERLIKTANELK